MLIKRLLCILLLISFSTISYSQEIVTYDPETKTFCIDIDKCDPCILGAENSQICKCREDCVIEENMCKEHCSHLVGNAYNHCLSKCYADNVKTCRDACGPIDSTAWPYIDFILMSLTVQAAEIPFHPLILNEGQIAIQLESRGYAIEEGHYELKNFYKFDDNCIDISEHDLSGLNFCFTYDISILIGESGSPDRKECRYNGSYCIIKG